MLVVSTTATFKFIQIRRVRNVTMSTVSSTTPAQQKVYLITGANRGIGRALAETYLARPSHTVVSLVRDPSNETSQSLLTHSSAANSKAILIPYDASNLGAASTALTNLNTHCPEIKHIDVLIANAGMQAYAGSSVAAPTSTFLEHYIANTLGPLELFQTFLPLLRAAPEHSPSTQPGVHGKFIAISSAGGSTTTISQPHMRFGTDGKPRGGALPYGQSKAALNHIMVKLDMEIQDVVVGLYTPGPTKTGLGGGNVKWETIPGVQELDTVAEGLVREFDAVSKVTGDNKLALKDWSGKMFGW